MLTVDEGEERRRWVPWILLALLIIAVGIATYFIMQAHRRSTESAPEPDGNLQNLGFNGDVETFDACGGGDRALITRLRDTAKQTTIQNSQVMQSQWDHYETVRVSTASISASRTSSNGFPVCFCASRL